MRSGGTPSKDNPAYWTGEIPWVSPKDMKSRDIHDTTDHISEAALTNSAASRVPAQSILVVVRSGVLAHTFPVAKTLAPVSFNQDIKALIPNSDLVDPEYLFWFVRSRAADVVARGVKKGATVHSVVSGYIERLQVPLPSREGQYCIVDLLSRADGIVRLRQEAQKKTAELTSSLFFDMFGDSTINLKRWPMVRLGDLVEKFEGGKNIQAGDDEAARHRILKISAVTSGRYLEHESKPAPQEFVPRPEYFVRPGDLLFSRANTESLVGATALVNQTDGRTLLPDKIWRLVWRDQAQVLPVFALHLFQQSGTRSMLSRIASGTGGSMKNISQAKLKELLLPIPPLPLQQQFAAIADQVQGAVELQVEATLKARAIFDAVLYRAFSSA